MKTLPKTGKWPFLFSKSDTTGEKDFEEFYTKNEILDMEKFEDFGVIKSKLIFNDNQLNHFENIINTLKS